MDVQLRIPDDIAAKLEDRWGDLSRRALEALAADAHREDLLSPSEAQRLLGLSSPSEAEELLQRRAAGLAAREAPASPARESGQEPSTALLSIALQEGFEGVPVAISVNGEEVYRKSEVTTRLQISLADSLEVEVAAGPVTVEVALPDQGLSEELRFELAGTLYLGVSLSPAGEIVYRTSATPYGYL